MNIKIKRVYEKPEKSDGKRILVDRIWPRGLTKEQAAADIWIKEIAPSNELRKWFNHEPEKWAAFKRKYKAELEANPEAVQLLKKSLNKTANTLIYGAKDETHNQAVVLQEWLEKK